jgi:hypothetical protein
MPMRISSTTSELEVTISLLHFLMSYLFFSSKPDTKDPSTLTLFPLKRISIFIYLGAFFFYCSLLRLGPLALEAVASEHLEVSFICFLFGLNHSIWLGVKIALAFKFIPESAMLRIMGGMAVITPIKPRDDNDLGFPAILLVFLPFSLSLLGCLSLFFYFSSDVQLGNLVVRFARSRQFSCRSGMVQREEF